MFYLSRYVEHNGENGISNRYHMNEIDHFKLFILCSGDVEVDVDHLHVKRIH
jgi:fructose-specific phosphotransferase system component IIB